MSDEDVVRYKSASIHSRDVLERFTLFITLGTTHNELV